MNNEPVAWMDEDENVVFEKCKAYPIPLYTHKYERPHNTVLVPCDKLAEMQAEIASLKKEAALQRLSDFTQEAEALKAHPAKELTIEEIDEVSKEIFKGYKNFYHYQINFARAILRKAQEK